LTWPKQTHDVLRRLEVIRKDLADQFYLRAEAVDVLALGAVCHEHVLLLGPPGTAKTDLVTRFATLIDAPRFHYLLTRFTEPAEIFGPMDLTAFQAGTYHVRTEGMLPRASIAFLDEVFQGSSAILNTLLTLVHERVFYNGGAREPVPLISLVGASNDLPDDPMLHAFSDRFALRVHVAPVPDEGLKHLLDRGWELELHRLRDDRRAQKGERARALPLLAEDQIRGLYHQLAEVKLDAVRPVYEQILRELRAEGMELSDRRLVKGLKLVAGAALLAGRAEAAIPDLWPLYHLWSRIADAPVFRSTVEPHLVAGGAARVARTRDPADLLADLETLQKRGRQVRGEAAVGAHLMALGRLRREAALEHPADRALRETIDAAVHAVMAELEAAHV
jgi:MoxR-like ATPase